MTRKEEIENAAYLSSFNSDDFGSFIRGAEWSDKHPSVDTVKKIICYALRFTNIMLADNLEEGVEWELIIKKAMEK